MALALLDGTTAAVDVSFGATPVSHKCLYRYMSADIVRDFAEATTFCSGGWRSRRPGMKQMLGRLDGYMGKGDAITSPAQFFATTIALAFIATFDALCTLTGSIHVGRLHLGIQAALFSEQGVDLESDGAVTIAWVVA